MIGKPKCLRNECFGSVGKIFIVLLSLSMCTGFRTDSSENDKLEVLRVERKASSSMDQFSKDFSILARIVNSISLQEGFSDGSIKFEDFIAELLDIESGKMIPGLLNVSIDAKGFSAKLDKASSLISKLKKNPVGDSSQVKEGIQALEDLKENIGDLEHDFQNTLDGLEKMYDLSRSINLFKEAFDTTALEEVAPNLNALMYGGLDVNDKNGITDINNALKAIPGKQSNILSALIQLNGYNKKLSALLKVKDKSIALDSLLKFSLVAEKYQKNGAILESLPTKMASLQTDFSSLMPIVNEHGSLGKVSDFMKSINPYVETLETRRTLPRTITSGFFGGPKDFPLLKTDLSSDWFKTKVAEGKNANDLQKSSPIAFKLSENMNKTNENWIAYKKNHNAANLTKSYSSTFDILAKEGKALAPRNDISSSITSVSGAVNSLKKMNGNPQFDEFRALYDYASKVSTQAGLIDAAFKEIMKIDQTNADEAMANVSQLAIKTANLSWDDTFAVVRDIRKVKGFKELVDLVKLTISELKKFKWPELEKLLMTNVDWKSVESVKNSLDGTGLVDTLKNLQGTKYDGSGIEKMLSFGMTAREVSTSDFNTLKSIVTSLYNLKTDLKAIETTIPTGKKGRRRRNASKKLQNSQNLAKDLGNGVYLFKKLAEVYEKRAVVTSAVGAPPNIQMIVSKTEPSWTDANRDSLKKMPKELEDLEKFASQNIGNKDLIHLGKIFDKASSVLGAPVKTDKFKQSVVPDLKAHQKEASTFSELGDLELNYAQHSVSIKAASLTLPALRSYFDEVFGIKRTGDSVDPAQASNASSSDGVPITTLVIIGSVVVAVTLLALAAVYVGCKVKKNRKYKNELNDPDTWVLLRYTSANFGEFTSTPPLFSHLENKDINAFKRSLDAGAYVDAYKCTLDNVETLLHKAVRDNKKIFVEELIKRGADREALNQDYQTPLELAEKLEKKDCVKIFKKYKNKKFKLVIPHQLSSDEYKISVDARYLSKEESKKFSKKFEDMMYVVAKREQPSHVVFHTDEKGILEVEEFQLEWIFSPAMILNQHWMSACIKDSSRIVDNHEFRVKKIRYNGNVYDLLPIKDAYNRSKVPYLFGVSVTLYNYTRQHWAFMKAAIEALGGRVYHGDFAFEPVKKDVYHRDELSNYFLLYRENQLEEVKAKHPDVIAAKIYELCDDKVFINFILQFETKSEKLAAAAEKKKATEKKGKKGKKNQLSVEENSGDSGAEKTKGESTTMNSTMNSTMNATSKTEATSITNTPSTQTNPPKSPENKGKKKASKKTTKKGKKSKK